MNKTVVLLAAFLGILWSSQAAAAAFKFNKHRPYIGKVQAVVSRPGDTLKSLARQHDIGFDELHHANPQLQEHHAIKPGTVVLLPTFYILPRTRRSGIVINLPEKRMFVYRGSRVYTFPVGIGREGWATPEGTLYVAGKKANPHWHVPKAVLQAQKENGNDLPEIIPPGPKNPLGKYAIRLSKTNYLIHGTNDPDGVGRRSSAGCLRMYPEDIKQLFKMVRHRMRVHIVNQPFKIAKIRGEWFLESHAPLQESEEDRNAKDGGAATIAMSLGEAITEITNQISEITHLSPDMDWIRSVLIHSSGIPSRIVHHNTQEQFLNELNDRSI